uniref:Uncharacterized protein n=1 Tax=Timema monikensis TaxID=170555 RepID=A0A7R9EBZ4_9NEOP|nr:unnamed protein product [Timema monikensis]
MTAEEYLLEYDSRRGVEYSRFHGYTYDGVWAVALAIQHVAHRIRHIRHNQTMVDFRYRDPLWEDLFLDALKNTSFEGVTVSICLFAARVAWSSAPTCYVSTESGVITTRGEEEYSPRRDMLLVPDSEVDWQRNQSNLLYVSVKRVNCKAWNYLVAERLGSLSDCKTGLVKRTGRKTGLVKRTAPEVRLAWNRDVELETNDSFSSTCRTVSSVQGSGESKAMFRKPGDSPVEAVSPTLPTETTPFRPPGSGKSKAMFRKPGDSPVETGPVRFYDNERKASILLKQFQSKYDVVLQLRLKLNMEYERSECVVKRVKILCVNVNVMVNDGLQALWSDGTEVKVGEFNGVMEQLDLSRGQPIRWHGRAPPKDRTLQIFEHSHVNITIYSILAAAASAGIVMAITFLSINITFRNQRGEYYLPVYSTSPPGTRGEYYLPVYQHHLQEPEVSTTFLSINITSRNQRNCPGQTQSLFIVGVATITNGVWSLAWLQFTLYLPWWRVSLCVSSGVLPFSKAAVKADDLTLSRGWVMASHQFRRDEKSADLTITIPSRQESSPLT